ncbi:hypothetical protein [Rickettsia endosymbiont of Ixodes pacificus]|uniref:hypothetical protein n=1 Tax=Rickettsia endosymbiont of Ixodes pacificus TaxID=1133329 RepID=UPI0012E09D70|nr:hypothetical protein [Rickettsia endosymbiont of Ixodes pacificus]
MDRFSVVIPRLDRGIQLKILILLVFSVVFWIPWSKPRDDTEWVSQSTQQHRYGMTLCKQKIHT